MASEFGFRPCKIEDLKGQPKVQKMLQIYIKAAQIKKESFPHTIITGQSGCGKAQPVDTIIPTPDGDKRLGDIAVGDYVFDRLGKPTKVLGVFPQGKLDNYKVTFKDGRSTYCNDEHLWSYCTSKDNLKTMTLREIIDNGIYRITGNGRRDYKYKVPISKAVEYTHKNFNVHPYIVGAFLGDGCCLQSQLTLSSENDEIPKIVASLLPEKFKAVPFKYTQNNYNWCFKLKSPCVNATSGCMVTTVQTKQLFSTCEEQVCCNSHSKRIPEEYFYGDIEQRLNLLQGLLDTDGYARVSKDNRTSVSFTSVNINLIHDVIRLANSLGFYCPRIYSDTRKKYKTGICYSITISCSDEEKPKLFKLNRKKMLMASAIGIKKHNFSHNHISIIDIEKMPEKEEMVCIYVDNDEHLYLTNDFIVTHNTTVSNVIAHELGYGFKAFSGPAINDKKVIDEILLNLKENDVLFIDEIHRISQRLQESLYFAMEQFEADVVVDGVATRVSLPHFTLIAATNLYGGLNDALLNRFPIQIKLAAYSKTDMASIVEKICQEKKIKIDEESVYKIAATTRGIPRNANSYVARVYDFALVMNDGVINPEIVDEALYVMGINKFGLNQDDMDYMNFLNSNTRAVGVDTICLTLGMDKDTVQTKIEPYLLSKCYIQKQPRGRVITDLGRVMMEECE